MARVLLFAMSAGPAAHLRVQASRISSISLDRAFEVLEHVLRLLLERKLLLRGVLEATDGVLQTRKLGQLRAPRPCALGRRGVHRAPRGRGDAANGE